MLNTDDVAAVRCVRGNDNNAVIDAQLSKLKRLREMRDEQRVAAALRALTDSASAYDSAGGHNLMALAIEAARAKCTVGEISDALERQWGRYSPSCARLGM